MQLSGERALHDGVGHARSQQGQGQLWAHRRESDERRYEVLDALVLAPSGREQDTLGACVVAAPSAFGVYRISGRIDPGNPLWRHPEPLREVVAVLKAETKDVVGTP